MSTEKLPILRWFLTVYYVPKISAMLVAIGTMLIGPHCGLHVGKYAVPDDPAMFHNKYEI